MKLGTPIGVADWGYGQILVDADGATLHTRADLECVARAVNAYDDLVAACEAALEDNYELVVYDPEFSLGPTTVGQLKAALAKAKGE